MVDVGRPRGIEMRKLFQVLATSCALVVPAAAHAAEPPLRDVVVVGSNWAGTAEIFDPHTFKVLKRLDIVPDREERMQEIANASLKRRILFHLIRWRVGE